MATPYLPTEQAVAQSSPEVLGIERQRKLADLLTAQAFAQPQGQMISGHYVAPSWTQQLAPLASALAGGAISERADKKQEELASALRQQKAASMTKFQELMANPETRSQAMKFAAGDQFLQPLVNEMMKPQKLGEGENLIIPTMSGSPINLGAGGAKIAGEVRQAMQLLGINKPLEQLTPQELQAINAKTMEVKQAGAANINMGQRGFDNTLKLGDKFTAEPIYKAYQEVRQAYQQVNKSLDEGTAVGDVAAATKIAKLLDPTSVVRETELATVANAKGAVDRLAQLSEYVMTGKTLGPEQRKEFRSLAKQFLDVAGTQYNEARAKYSEIGKRNDLGDVETVLGAPYKPATGGKWGTATVEQK